MAGSRRQGPVFVATPVGEPLERQLDVERQLVELSLSEQVIFIWSVKFEMIFI